MHFVYLCTALKRSQSLKAPILTFVTRTKVLKREEYT